MSDLKIGIIEPVGAHGGMNYYDYGLALGLHKNDVDVTLYTCDKTAVNFKDEVRTKLTYRNIWGNRNKILRMFSYFAGSYRSFRDAKKRGIKILHFHYFDVRILETFDLLLSSLMGFKKIVTIHDIETFQANTKRMFSLNSLNSRIDKYIVHNETSKNILCDRFTILENKINVIPHGNFDLFVNDQVKPEYSDLKEMNSDDYVLLFFGQIKDVKGLDLLLNALSICKKSGQNLKLIIAGKAWQSDFDKYDQLINQLNLEESVVKRIEYIPDNEVASYYDKADLIVLPYKRIYQSGVLLMSMTYGKPVLVSDLETMKETIQDQLNGFTFQTENADDLADKIIFIKNNPELAEKVVNQSLVDIKEKYDWTKIGSKTKMVYNAV